MLDVYADLNAVAAELTAIRKLLERIADSLAPVLPLAVSDTPYVAGIADLHTIDDAAAERSRVSRIALAYQWGFVPDSPAFDHALQEYEQEVRRTHGSDIAIDWDAAFREARGQTETGAGPRADD